MADEPRAIVRLQNEKGNRTHLAGMKDPASSWHGSTLCGQEGDLEYLMTVGDADAEDAVSVCGACLARGYTDMRLSR